jgi:outer membrane protein OmpA-like peptidoglycan-associated protein
MLAVSLMTVSLLTPTAFAAGGEQGDVELSFFAGYALLDDYEPDTAPGLKPEDDVVGGTRIGLFLTSGWSLEGSFQVISTRTDFDAGPPNVDLDLDSFRINALYNFRRETGFRPFLTFGVGLEGTDAGALLDASDIGANVGGGLRWFAGKYVTVRVDARWSSIDVGGIVDNRQGNLETSLGFGWAFGGGPPPDSDGDGVSDRKDKCPATPRGAVVDAYGCPSDLDGDGVFYGIDKCPDTPSGYRVDATGCPVDSDGDGVNDALDNCPDTPLGATVDASGCPMDGDGDGVYDGIDKCPDTPRGATVDASGCPTDSDGDGVYDGIDKCPDTPEGATVDTSGCPMDSDGDGVYDGIDQCPGTPAGTTVNALGCAVLFKEEQKTIVLKDVNFEHDSADLTPQSTAFLDSVVVSMTRIVTELRVEVAGHTDSTGSAASNQTLSQRRAQAVRDYLVRKGVEASRVIAKGYGESEPIADNTTPLGRAKNRRVELTRLD